MKTAFAIAVLLCTAEVIITETELGRGILGVVDGFSPKGVEDKGEIQWRKDLLRQIGDKV